MENNNQAWYYSWWAILIAFIVFWPVGIGLLILKNKNDKQSVFLGTTDKKKYIIVGAALIFVGFSTFSNSIMMGLFMIAGGIALILYAEQLKRRAERNRQYIELIANRGETSMDKIANTCNIQYDVVVKELRTLVNRNILKNAIIDETYRTITVRRETAPQNNTFENVFTEAGIESQPAGTVENEQVTCTCPGCGAKVVLTRGTTENCEYCDTPITAQ